MFYAPTLYLRNGRSIRRLNYENNQQDALYRLIIIPSRIYMFRVMFSPIIRNLRLYLQYLVVFTQVAAGWCHQPAAALVCTTRYRKYSQVLRMMGENLARNM